MIRTLNLHLLLVGTEDANFFRDYAKGKGVGLGVLCEQLVELNYEWVCRVFNEGSTLEELKHDFAELLK